MFTKTLSSKIRLTVQMKKIREEDLRPPTSLLQSIASRFQPGGDYDERNVSHLANQMRIKF